MCGKDEDRIQRAPYVRPELVKYGTVRNMTGGSLAVGTDTGFSAGKNKKSDIRCKEAIVRVGEHPSGYGLYLFSYRPEFVAECGDGRHFGVIAQEVARVMPDAVSYDAKGFASVDYAQLGIVIH